MIDSHVHLHRDDFAADRPDVVERAVAAGVEGFLNVGYDLASSEASVRLAERDSRFLATVGVHPHDASLLADEQGRPTLHGSEVLARLRDLATGERVVAIGEIGLDFYRDLSPRPAQRTALCLQLELAATADLPVVFHVRDAYSEIRALVDTVGVPVRGAVLHSFAGGPETVAWARQHGLILGIGGPVTYRNSRLPEILAGWDIGAVLLETDAPWLPPVPHRGQRNEPAFLRRTCEVLAGVLATTPEKLAQTTSENFARLFGRLPGDS